MPEKYIPDKHIHDGHRQRMRLKFKEHGSAVFDTYELLEMLLYNSIPLCDTNPIAKRLLCARRGLDGVLSSTVDELMSVDGVGRRTAELITTVGCVPELLACDPPLRRTMFSDYARTAGFFVDKLKDEKEYSILLLLLDNDMVPIALHNLCAKDFGSSAVSVDAFTAAALNADASVAVIAHNHPFGPNIPSERDIAMNELVEKALLDVDVVLAEHYVVCGDRYVGLVHRKFDRLRVTTELEDFYAGRERTARVRDEDMNIRADAEMSIFRPSDTALSSTAAILKPVSSEYAEEYAYSLLSLYGSFSRTLSVDYSRIARATDERTAHYLKLVARITSRRGTEKLVFGRMYTIREIKAYFKALFMGESVEKVYVMSVSADRRILGCEPISVGTVNGAGITPRAVLTVALKNKAHSVILAHNHPSGRAEASIDDKELTVTLSSILETSSIRLRAHYVVAGNECESVMENLDF